MSAKKEQAPLRLAAVNGERVREPQSWGELSNLLCDAAEPIMQELAERLCVQLSESDWIAISTAASKILAESARISSENLIEQIKAMTGYEITANPWGISAPDQWAELAERDEHELSHQKAGKSREERREAVDGAGAPVANGRANAP